MKQRLRVEDQEKQTMVLDLNTYEGRFAARAYAYSILADNPEKFKEIIELVGREG